MKSNVQNDPRNGFGIPELVEKEVLHKTVRSKSEKLDFVGCHLSKSNMAAKTTYENLEPKIFGFYTSWAF